MAKTRKLLIEFSESGSPDTYDFNCTINTNREFTIEGTTIDITDPNCVDPDAPAWVARVIDTLSAGITGEGTMDPISYGELRDKMLAGASFPVRVTLDETGAVGGGYYQGAYVMTSLGMAKEGRGYVTVSVEMQSDGAITWTNAV